uniref:4-nitrophenylphosphatase n=1 Tax=Glossina brevipalpis TaxID=37001 RepID=A0A1A9W8Z9_9MUSC
MKFFKDLNQSEKLEFFNSFDLVFCDCDGVIWQNLHDAIPGSADAVNHLIKLGKEIAFVTNNSIVPSEIQLEKFSKININIEKILKQKNNLSFEKIINDQHNLIHPARSIADYLESLQFNGLILCFGSPPFKSYLEERGYQLVQGCDGLVGNSIIELRNAIYSKEPVKAVIIDVEFNCTAWKLMRAQMHLNDPECLLIAGAADPKVPFGPGAFIKILEEATDRKALVLGKPGFGLKDILLQKFNIEHKDRVLFIGDSLKSDIEFGKICGFQTMLVLTGATKLKDLEQSIYQNEESRPDIVVESLKDIINLI